MKNRKMIVIILATVVLLFAAGIISLNVLTHVDEDSICENVYIDSLNIGGMSREEAEKALDAYIEELSATEVTVNVEGNEVKTTLQKLGLSVDENSNLDDAMAAGKEGSLLQRYRDLKKIKNDKLVFNLTLKFEDEKINKLIKKCKKYDVEPKNAVLTRENGEFQATESVDGLTIDVDKTKESIQDALANWNKEEEIAIDATVAVEKAKITKEQALLCDSVLGTYSTSFASSSANRKKNVQNGAARINGTVLYPGEEFSAATTMGPFEESNGYALAGSYLNGKTVESFGGGVCQVSTTLYNALLLSEVDITERYNHSMTVSYVKPSMDAAISGTSKDLKFKNNTDAPIYIQAYASSGTLTFTVWGNETRASNRSIEYVSEVVETIQPGNDVITEDPSLPSTYSKVESSAHTGCKANLYKIVYIDGVQQSKEKVNYSSYAASPNYITVGTQKEEEKEEEPSEEKEEESADKKDPSKEEAEATKSPLNPTEKPSATPKPTKAPVSDSKTEATEKPKQTATAKPTAAPKE